MSYIDPVLFQQVIDNIEANDSACGDPECCGAALRHSDAASYVAEYEALLLKQDPCRIANYNGPNGSAMCQHGHLYVEGHR